jgi:peptidoglycan/xylan/chitin deacetylase (PgdA/CDA1 family)
MFTRRLFLAAAASTVAAQEAPAFHWPAGKRVGLSLSFDDARLSQVDTGLALFRKLGVKATFYLVPSRAESRKDGWKQAVVDGHEIGNHSRMHACTVNYGFSKRQALEDYNLDQMAAELKGATADIEKMLGVKTVSFAYPCGQKFVGRGKNTRSYIPVVADQFLTGRGYLDERANDPARCDFAQLMGQGFDDMDFDAMLRMIAAAEKERRWVVFAGHEIGTKAFQTTDTKALEKLAAYCADPKNGVWLDTVANIAKYVAGQRKTA